MQLFNQKYAADIIGKAKTYKIGGMDWKDIAQELDIALWKNLPKFEGRNNANERTFAIKIMNHKIIDLAKSSNRKKRFLNSNCLSLENIKKIIKGEEIVVDVEDPKWQRVFIQNMRSPVGVIWE